MPVSQKPKQEERAALRHCIEAPRWAGFAAAVRQVCWQLKLDLDLREDKHFLTTTVYYTATGPSLSIEVLRRWIKRTITEWNGD